MTDPYALNSSSPSISSTTGTTPSNSTVTGSADPTSAQVPARRSTALWWVLLALAVVANLVSSAGAAPLAVGIGAGVVTIVSIVALVLARVRRR